MPALARILKDLLEGQEIAQSNIPKTAQKKVDRLLDAGILEKKRKGSGWVVLVAFPHDLQQYAYKNYPSGLEVAIEGVSNRAESVTAYKNAKKRNVSDREFLLFRTFSERTDLVRYNDGILPINDWCHQAGVASIELKEQDKLFISGTIGLVENIDVFWHFEKLKLPVDIIYYTAGRFSNRFLHSIAPVNDFKIVHFGDYDPVGVDEYLRLKQLYKDTTFYYPENIELLFERYGNSSILEKKKNQRLLATLRKSGDLTAKYLVSLMDRSGTGLEQEVLLTLS